MRLVMGVTNGIRQSGILSPLLFNVYVDDLCAQLNHLMYADDLFLISPSSAGLEKLLDVCQRFGIAHDSDHYRS